MPCMYENPNTTVLFTSCGEPRLAAVLHLCSYVQDEKGGKNACECDRGQTEVALTAVTPWRYLASCRDSSPLNVQENCARSSLCCGDRICAGHRMCRLVFHTGTIIHSRNRSF